MYSVCVQLDIQYVPQYSSIRCVWKLKTAVLNEASVDTEKVNSALSGLVVEQQMFRLHLHMSVGLASERIPDRSCSSNSPPNYYSTAHILHSLSYTHLCLKNTNDIKTDICVRDVGKFLIADKQLHTQLFKRLGSVRFFLQEINTCIQQRVH